MGEKMKNSRKIQNSTFLKKITTLLLVVLMLNSSLVVYGESTISVADEQSDTHTMTDEEILVAELVSETWYDVSSVNSEDSFGGRLYFNEDGTGYFKNGTSFIDQQWEVTDNCVTTKYVFGGTYFETEFLLRLNKDKGRYELRPKEGSTIYLQESDVTMKLSNAVVGSQIELGTYEMNNDVEDGPEVIRWIVADNYSIDGYVILVSYYGLDVQQYHNEDTDITWENCSLRKWLNEDFYNTAFSNKEKNIISSVNLENPANKRYGTDGGNSTLDTVWMFGEYDAENYYELMSRNNGKVYTTAYAQSLGAKEVDVCWLRTPGSQGNNAAVTHSASNFGEVHSQVIESQVVRPAILVSKEAEVFICYDEFISYGEFLSVDDTSSEVETDSLSENEIESEVEAEAETESESASISSDDAEERVADDWNMQAEIGLIDMYLTKSVDCYSIKNLNAASLSFVREDSDNYIFVVKGTFSAYDDYGNFDGKYNFEQQYKVDKGDGSVSRDSLETFK